MTLAELNAAGRDAFVGAAGPLFEHSPWVAEAALASRPFAGARDLHSKLCAAMRAAPRERRLALIRAHPDLAERLDRLSAASQGEQAGAGLDRLEPAEREEFRRLNDAYRGRFGFPFVICARLNAKDAILAAMRDRLGHDAAGEEEAALAEIEKIAWLRLEDLLRK
ncbi:MAG TPA: 2-oxo-4-hydroxy-4-carboxy-5-ureidoimidazoline decarboxylase [Opitutaceae bacterium]|nr:2-oxo-4-hydroxy-4-carboxy-5-ureidoimidazoline decarboxylase [Opitutaceae bacterium]